MSFSLLFWGLFIVQLFMQLLVSVAYLGISGLQMFGLIPLLSEHIFVLPQKTLFRGHALKTLPATKQQTLLATSW